MSYGMKIFQICQMKGMLSIKRGLKQAHLISPTKNVSFLEPLTF